MHTKRLLSIGFITLLLTSLAAVIMPVTADHPPSTQPNQMWVEPTGTPGLKKSNSFTVEVKLNITAVNLGGTGLMAFEYKFQWNSTLISCTSYTKCDPPTDLGWGAYFEAKDSLTAGQHWYGVSGLADPTTTPFMGVVTLATYDFHVEYQPWSPFETDINGTLKLADVKLGDDVPSSILPITDIFDGWYIIEAIPVQPPKLKTEPAEVFGVLGQHFNVSIVIEDLHYGFDLCGWEAKLTYDTSMLDALNSFEGPFLPPFAGPNGTFYINNINDSIGQVHTAGLFLGNHTAPSGTGALALIEFNATWEYTSPPLFPGDPGTFCWINLTDVKLVDCSSNPINFSITQITKYNAPYKTLGWSLDCYTDSYRKKCETPYTGKLPQVNADAYEPQDLVILYAYLSYNEWPAQDKIVSFEIYGPRNPYYNVTIFRTAQTNASGIAVINFTLPHPCENVEDIVFGKWMCFQKAQVKFGNPNDTLWFTVGWIVELLEASADPQPVWPCAEVRISFVFKNIMMIEKYVLFIVTLYDELLDPIGTAMVGVWVPAGEWCHPAYYNASVWIHIPKWVHVGPGAVAYVNAFTDLPSNCGCPYSPEIWVRFTISVPP